MEKNFSVEARNKKRARIEDKIETIKSVIMWALIILFVILVLSGLGIIPEINGYAGIYTFLVLMAISVVAYARELIKLFEC